MKSFFIYLICLVFFVHSYGQETVFNHITVENGLSSNSVLAIAQDARGFMWYGTRTGLCRYDGTHFRVYRSDVNDSTSITNNNINALFCDSKHRLWIGSSGGVNLYNPQKGDFERLQLRNAPVFCFYEDRKGNIWIGGSNGFYLLTGGQRSKIHFFSASESGLSGGSIRCFFEDHAGNIWIGSNLGLTRMQWIGNRYQFETLRHDPKNPVSLSADYVTTIEEDDRHRLWIGTQSGGLNLFYPEYRIFNHFLHSNNDHSGIVNNNIRKILKDKNGKLWIGTQEGLSILDPDNNQIRSYQHDANNKSSLSQNSIYSLFEDVNGSMWIGTYFGGVNAVYSYETAFNTFQNKDSRTGLSNNVVSSIVEDSQHNLWIGTEGGGLNYLNRATGMYTVYKNKLNDASCLGSNLVKVVYIDKDGNPWVGTHGGGLNVLDRTTNTFKRYLYKENDPVTQTLEITSLLEDERGRFWAVTNSGIKLFKRNKKALEPLNIATELNSLPYMQGNVLFEDRQKNVWIGASPGLYKISGRSVIQINSEYNVNCICQDENGNFWLGLSYGGLALYDQKTGKLTRYTQGLSNTNVIGLLNDNEGNLWLSTDNGLIKFTPSQKRFQTYTVSDGLAGNEFNNNSYLKDSRGEMFFGGFNGITHFFPDRIKSNNYAAPVVFTGLKLLNNDVEMADANRLLREDIGFAKELQFSHNQDVFTIEFALLNFIKSRKNRYSYKLEGFDKNWNESTIPSATYTKLPPGSYTFWVKGANNDGLWSAPVSIKIKVLPPFWLTWWAYCIYILILAGILFLVVRFFFLRELFKKEDELHQIKLNFFTNISHEIRTHLTLIMAPVDQLMDEKEKTGFDYQQLAQVKNNTNRLLKLVSELMDFRKAETQHLKLQVARYNLISFLQDIYTSFRELSLAKNIKTSFIHDTEETMLYYDKEQLEKVFFNLLANAFKFTPAGGHIVLHVEQKERGVVISVKDNGRGIAPQYLEKLFTNFFQVADHGFQNTGYGIGLALSKHIVELHKGTITVESEPASSDQEGKTVFTVTLQKGNQQFEGTGFLLPANNKVEETISFDQDPLLTHALPIREEKKEKAFSILVVEDNAELRTLIHQTFIQKYEVLVGENGLEGWNTATEQIPDLIISDVMMPEMDGFSLCEKLKTDERTSHIPVVLLTAKSSQSEQISGLETGADVYLTKPFNTKVLELNVRNLLLSRERMRKKFSQQILEQPASEANTNEVIEDSVANAVDKEFLNKIIQIIEEQMDNPEFGVDMLSRKVAMSAPVLYKKLRAVTNMSVNEFVKSLRLKKAALLLQQKQYAVFEVSYMVGFNDRKYFSREFKKQYGKTPSEYSGSEETV